MRNRSPYDDLDNALDKLAAFLRLMSSLQDMEPEDRAQHLNGEGYLMEVAMAECFRARQSFSAAWRDFKAANDDRRVS